MKPRPTKVVYEIASGLVLLCCVGCAQQNPETSPQTASTKSGAAQVKTDFDRSRLVKDRGVLKNRDGGRVTGVVGVLFAIYEQQEGGAPLWQEVQNVEVDDLGHFTAMVGATKSEGIPPELFAAEKTRWLGKQVLLPGEVEQPRIRLVSTSEGLVAERGVRLVLPPESDDQSATGATQQAWEQAADSPTDENANRPSKSKPRFHRRRLVP
jgi:hypothetical protein